MKNWASWEGRRGRFKALRQLKFQQFEIGRVYLWNHLWFISGPRIVEVVPQSPSSFFFQHSAAQSCQRILPTIPLSPWTPSIHSPLSTDWNLTPSLPVKTAATWLQCTSPAGPSTALAHCAFTLALLESAVHWNYARPSQFSLQIAQMDSATLSSRHFWVFSCLHCIIFIKV